MGYLEFSKIVNFYSKAMVGPDSADALRGVGDTGTLRPLRKFNTPKKSKKKSDDEYKYNAEEQVVVENVEHADIISSDLPDYVPEGKQSLIDKIISGTYHAPVLDIDIPHKYVASTTEGHGHIYFDVPIPWVKYVKLLKAMADCGILEEGYVSASIERGYTAVRPPWVTKPPPAEVPEPAVIHKDDKPKPKSEPQPKSEPKTAGKVGNVPVVPQLIPGKIFYTSKHAVLKHVMGWAVLVPGEPDTAKWYYSDDLKGEPLSESNYKKCMKMLSGKKIGGWELVKLPLTPEVFEEKIPSFVKYGPEHAVAKTPNGWTVIVPNYVTQPGTWYGKMGGSESLSLGNYKKTMKLVNGEEVEGWKLVKAPFTKTDPVATIPKHVVHQPSDAVLKTAFGAWIVVYPESYAKKNGLCGLWYTKSGKAESLSQEAYEHAMATLNGTDHAFDAFWQVVKYPEKEKAKPKVVKGKSITATALDSEGIPSGKTFTIDPATMKVNFADEIDLFEGDYPTTATGTSGYSVGKFAVGGPVLQSSNPYYTYTYKYYDWSTLDTTTIKSKYLWEGNEA